MADNLLDYVFGIPSGKDDFVSKMLTFKKIRETRKIYDRTTELLNSIKNNDATVRNIEAIDSVPDEELRNLKLSTEEEVKLVETTIQTIHPGIEIYEEKSVGCLFRIDSMTLDMFAIGRQTRERYGGSTSELLTSLNQSVFLINDPALAQFLFFVMSFHEDVRLVEYCLIALTKVQNSFKPTLKDIFAVFMNWGCSKNILYPKSYAMEFQPPESLQNASSGTAVSSDLHHNIENVLLYLQSWTSDIEERKLLIRILLLSSLEKRFRSISCHFRVCIHVLIHRNKWSCEDVIPFVKLLHFKDLHYHDQAQASYNMMGISEFASWVSTSLAFASLQQLFEHKEINYVQKVDGSCVLSLELKAIERKCSYEIYVIVWLLKVCMMEMKSEKDYKNCFKYISSWLRRLKVNLPKETSYCDEEILKEFINRMLTT